MPKLKAAAVSFLNAWPLTAGLETSDRISSCSVRSESACGTVEPAMW